MRGALATSHTSNTTAREHTKISNLLYKSTKVVQSSHFSLLLLCLNTWWYGSVEDSSTDMDRSTQCRLSSHSLKCFLGRSELHWTDYSGCSVGRSGLGLSRYLDRPGLMWADLSYTGRRYGMERSERSESLKWKEIRNCCSSAWARQSPYEMRSSYDRSHFLIRAMCFLLYINLPGSTASTRDDLASAQRNDDDCTVQTENIPPYMHTTAPRATCCSAIEYERSSKSQFLRHCVNS